MTLPYTIIAHPADFGIRITAPDLAGLFANAALALSDLLTDRERLAGGEQRSIRLTGGDLETLMVDWLRELLYLYNGEEMLVRSAEMRRVDAGGLEAVLHCDAYDPRRHAIRMEIKAVTYHQLEVRRTQVGWEAVVLFDI